MLGLIVTAIAVLVSSEGTRGQLPPCTGFEARLVAANRQVQKGDTPAFTLMLRNAAAAGVRLLDTRGGRRRDLGDSYYELVVLKSDGAAVDVHTAISDPGPISDEDWFVLSAGQDATLPVTTPLALEELRAGKYRAHVIVNDPSNPISRCQSLEADFRVVDKRSPTRR